MDRASREAIKQRLFELYLEAQEEAYLEVRLPEFGHTVLYSDNMYDCLKTDYVFPSNLVQKYQQTMGINTASDALFMRVSNALNQGGSGGSGPSPLRELRDD